MNPNQQQQQQLMRVPKQEMSRRYVQQPPPPRQQTQRSQNGSGGGGTGKKGGGMSSVTIEEVMNNSYSDFQNNQSITGGTGNQQFKLDEDKLPVFLIKLWNIVDDAHLQPIVHWDESGASFHIADPYSFCRNVLPHFFKHNNLNSLIRQLNMYGFRKMTPLSQGGLTRTESDQDHLEFSHPCFVQGRPELLTQIKRKQSAKTVEEKQVSEQTQQNLDIVMSEMRSIRDKAKNMEDKMNKLTKENREMWNQMGAMRQQHARQQQYFKKLLHFLVSVMQPGLSKRVAKRGVLEIDFGANNGATPNKRTRMNSSDEGPYKDVCELLESLQRESQEPFTRRFANNDHGGPLISEVTDEFGNSPAGRGANDLFPEYTERVQSSRYSDATDSREASPHPIISQPLSNGQMQNGVVQEQKPQEMYLGSGPLTHENVHRSTTKRDYQGHQMSSGIQNGSGPSTSSGRTAQKRAPYKQASRNLAQTVNPQEYQGNPSNNYNYNTMPAQLTYQPPQQQPSMTPQKSLMAIEDQQDPHMNLYSPTLGLSPSFDRQLSQELQEYLNGMDTSMDSLRDMVSNSNWDAFGDNLPDDDDDEQHFHLDDQRMNGGNGQMGQQNSQYPLALKNSPENAFYDDAGELLDPLLGDNQFSDNGFQIPDPNYMPLPDEELFPHSPVLRTPSPSDPNPNLV
uniref:HSF_DOMAIN domain-containing protein n=1 Tax=Caenorhabditis tropicalis TaxID=1561998 RepID=A0A1I7TU59_9PELO